MLIEKPILHKLAEETIADLRRDGIECTPEDILWLNHAAGKVIRPTPADELTMLDPPVPCGNVLLWPLSIGARIWLDRYGKPWFLGTGDMEILAVAFAMAHSRKPTMLEELTSRLKAHVRVAFWAMRLKATMAELNRAIALARTPEDIDLVNIPFEGERAPRLAADYGDVVAQLCHFFGETPEYWFWRVSEEYCTAMLGKIAGVLPAEYRADGASSKFVMLSKYRLVVGEIRKRARKTDAGCRTPDAGPKQL